MPSNVEIKAKVDDLDRIRSVAARLAAEPCQTLSQEDVFFESQAGRLKLRMFPDGSGELIHYERPDTTGAKQSHYQLYKTARALELRRVLTGALREIVTVKKTRQLFIVGQTRVHVDDVEGLGTYMELEVVLEPGQTLESGSRIASDLMTKLGVQECDLVACAYADLILKKTESSGALARR